MNFRIGIDLGEVIEEAGRTHGECVGLAIRLESLAEEEGICISGTVYDQVKHKLPYSYDYQGECTVENIKQPVRVYRIAPEQKAVAKESGDKNKKPKQKKKLAQSINAAVIAALVVLALWQFYFRDATPPAPEVASGERIASLSSDKPSIALLPFVNLNRDSRQAYLSDGFTTDMIIDLAESNKLSVITRNRVIAYQGKPVRIKDVVRELGVQYVVEGSVLKSGNQVRIYAQLMDIKGRRLWTETTVREAADLSAVQDEIVVTFINLIEIKR